MFRIYGLAADELKQSCHDNPRETLVLRIEIYASVNVYCRAGCTALLGVCRSTRFRV